MSWGVRKFSGSRQWYRTDRWQRLRRRVLSEQPFCAMREQRERCRLVATEVDHIKPHRGDYSLIERTSNRCAGVATRKRLRGRFSARDRDGMNTACRSIPITSGTGNEPAERGRGLTNGLVRLSQNQAGGGH